MLDPGVIASLAPMPAFLGLRDLLVAREAGRDLRALIDGSPRLPQIVAETPGMALELLRKACRTQSRTRSAWGLWLASAAPAEAFEVAISRLFLAACRRGRFELARWLWARGSRLQGGSLLACLALADAAKSGRLDVVQWARALCDDAAGNLAERLDSALVAALSSAAPCGPQLVAWIQAERERLGAGRAPMDLLWRMARAAGGKIAAGEWLLAHDARAGVAVAAWMLAACGRGDEEAARWCWEQLDATGRTEATARARHDCVARRLAQTGRLGLIRWLDEVGGVDHCDVFRNACASGHLEVAQWAWQRLPTVIARSPVAFELRAACDGGHTDVARWLWAAIDWEPGEGAGYLRRHSIFQTACIAGRAEMAAWLWSLGLGLADARAAFEDACANASRPDVPQWLWGGCRGPDGRGLALADLRGRNGAPFVRACENGQVLTAAWLWELWVRLEAEDGLPRLPIRAARRLVRKLAGPLPGWLGALVLGPIGWTHGPRGLGHVGGVDDGGVDDGGDDGLPSGHDDDGDDVPPGAPAWG